VSDTRAILATLIALAGVGQIALSVGSLAIPKVLKWPEELARLRPLTRQVFWIYAGYICSSHVAFGLLSVLAAAELTDGSLLAAAVSGFIAVWWAVRLVLQFACLDRRDAPPGLVFWLAEAVLVMLFVGFASVYGWAAVANMRELLT
jgi:hypothetical protein